MLATMRSNPPHLTSSRPSSPSPSHSPSRNLKQSNNKSTKSTSNNNANKKSMSSQQRKQPTTSSSSSSTTVNSPQPSNQQSTPGLITLSKPISEQQDQVDSTASDSSKNKKKSSKSKKVSKLSSSTGISGNGPPSSPSPISSKAQPVAVKNSNKSSASKHMKKVEKDNGISQLSKSAPTTHNKSGNGSGYKTSANALLDSSSGWEMPSTPTRKGNERSVGASESKRDSGLTWQQQLLANSSGSGSHGEDGPQSRGISKNNSVGNLGGKKKSVDLEAHDSSLTWQQALLSSNKPRSTTGLAYDTFADARDAATFGASNSNANFQGRTRSGSLGNRNSHPDSSNSSIYIDDVFNQSSPISSVHHPSTPIKGRGKGNNKPTPNKANNQHPNVNAYAGPNFHNSPSPASLPAPQFKARNSRNFGNGLNGHHPLGESTSSSNNSYGSGSGSGSGSDSGSESGKEEMNRSTRSVTAPVDNRNSFNQDNRQTTIENLLARMMRTPI